MNHWNWNQVDEKSLEFSRAANYIKGKFQGAYPIFINQKISPYGRHFEVSYLNEKKEYSNHYVRWVDSEDLVTDD